MPAHDSSGLICTVETSVGLFNASLEAGTRRAIEVRESDEAIAFNQG